MILAAELSDRALSLGLLVSAVAFGFRHGFDWDHLAAIGDLASNQTKPRRSMFLATLYACGHALVVLVLGIVAIAFAKEVPAGVDAAMGRVVGVTLIALGGYVLIALVRDGRNFRMRSRWMLVIVAMRRAAPLFVPRSRRAGPEKLVIEHEHEHEHGHDDPGVHLEPALETAALHEHAHATVPLTVTVPSSAAFASHRHHHPHRHVLHLPADPLPSYGPAGAMGIGMLHGVGAETPTQVVIFAGAGVAGSWNGLLVLGAFLVGLIASNTAVAAAAAFGFAGSTRRVRLYLAISFVTAVCSLVIGTLFLLDRGDVLPITFSG